MRTNNDLIQALIAKYPCLNPNSPTFGTFHLLSAVDILFDLYEMIKDQHEKDNQDCSGGFL